MPTRKEVDEAIKQWPKKKLYWNNKAYEIIPHEGGPMLKGTITRHLIRLYQNDGTPNIDLDEVIIEDNHEKD